MSIEFRLIREAIDKNINEILLKWNARKVLLNESFDEDRKDQCPVCMAAGKQRFLKYSYVNMDEAVYKCESTACLYPFRNFKYKNYVDRTIFRYERITETDDNKSEKVFTSPTKMESDDIDNFNVNWLDDTFTDDLDSILEAPSDGQNCDIKDIINNICNGVGTTNFNSSPSKMRTEQSSTAPAPKLSKCLQYIQLLSPTKQSDSNKVEQETPTRQIADINKVVSVLKPKSKSNKTIRSAYKMNREIRPVQPMMQQKPLEFIDWLETVRKIEPNQIKEFEFASPAECSESRENHTASTSEKSSVPSNVHNTQPILIELLGTSESYALDGNRLPNISKPCLLYQLDANRLPITQTQIQTMPNVHPTEEITTQTLVNILSEDQMDTSPAGPIERSSFVSEENLSNDSPMINTEIMTINSMEMKRAKVEQRLKVKNLKQKMKLEKKEQKQQSKKKKNEIMMEQSKVNTVNANRKTFNIEVEEIFLGFETVEPFQPITLRKKELVWLNIE